MSRQHRIADGAEELWNQPGAVRETTHRYDWTLARQFSSSRMLTGVHPLLPWSATGERRTPRWPVLVTPLRLARVAAVEKLEAAVPFTINHGLFMTIAELDMTNMTESVARFPGGPKHSERLPSEHGSSGL